MVGSGSGSRSVEVGSRDVRGRGEKYYTFPSSERMRELKAKQRKGEGARLLAAIVSWPWQERTASRL